MEEKYCPLLTCAAKEGIRCMRENCAWWRTYYSRRIENSGACAILSIGCNSGNS